MKVRRLLINVLVVTSPLKKVNFELNEYAFNDFENDVLYRTKYNSKLFMILLGS